MSEKTEAFLRLAAETAPLETGMLASGESPPGAHMTRRYTAAEARELAARAELEPWAWDGAAPDLAATVCALEAERAEAMSAYLAETAERDALRAAVREYLAARFDERHADATAFTAFWDTNNMLAPDYPQKCAAHSAARARWKDADEKRITALAALREAAK